MLENQMRFCFYESLRFFLSWDGFLRFVLRAESHVFRYKALYVCR